MEKKIGSQQKMRASKTMFAEMLLIYLLDDDTLLAHDIAVQLEYFGYEVVILSQLDQLAAAISERPPAAIVMDLKFRNGAFVGAGEIIRNNKITGQRIPTVIISTRGNFATRLAAAHAGADGYFTKPVDVVALSARLDVLTVHEEIRPYRILIIDDDIPAAEYYGTILHDAGMDIKILRKLTDVLRVLDEYRPELVLMDAYMTACSGIDLAKLIRQDDMYLDVPIVFLSNEGDLGKQLDAIQSGADNFLVKPIKPSHLISALSSRAERYRALRGLIMSDSLTGLYNHSAIKENLIREISRARRSTAPLALAMIDIDFFKKVNDGYGHPVGDQVIRALSRLLQQRLRNNDVIGRYGGEEFAVIMPATVTSSAILVLDRIREAFSKILHHADEREFSVTFSAGVAGLTEHMDAERLFSSADAALYNAKRNGRNCIELA